MAKEIQISHYKSSHQGGRSGALSLCPTSSLALIDSNHPGRRHETVSVSLCALLPAEKKKSPVTLGKSVSPAVQPPVSAHFDLQQMIELSNRPFDADPPPHRLAPSRAGSISFKAGRRCATTASGQNNQAQLVDELLWLAVASHVHWHASARLPQIELSREVAKERTLDGHGNGRRPRLACAACITALSLTMIELTTTTRTGALGEIGERWTAYQRKEAETKRQIER